MAAPAAKPLQQHHLNVMPISREQPEQGNNLCAEILPAAQKQSIFSVWEAGCSLSAPRYHPN